VDNKCDPVSRGRSEGGLGRAPAPATSMKLVKYRGQRRRRKMNPYCIGERGGGYRSKKRLSACAVFATASKL